MNRHSSSGAGTAQAAPPKRARILDAAVQVFAEKGFYNSKVSEIAHVAGVADGTIYLYFKSKDDLLISLFEDRMAEVNATVRAALASTDEPVGRLRAVVERHLALIAQHPAVAEVLTVELRQSSKFMKEYSGGPAFGEFLKLIASAVEDGQHAGVMREGLDPATVARALFGALDELALTWLLRRRSRKAASRGTGAASAAKEAGADASELARAADQLATLFLDGLRRPAPSSQHSQRRSS